LTGGAEGVQARERIKNRKPSIVCAVVVIMFSAENMKSAHVSDSRKRELAQIHIAKHQLGWDDDTYRDMLWTVAQVKSASELDEAGRKNVIDYLKSHGWKSKPAPKAKQPRLADNPQSKMIRALWFLLYKKGRVRDPSEKALMAWVKRMTGIDAAQWLSPSQASRVIESLKKWLERTEQEGG
jgi:phage gp16-like protein